jgi:hypothetical protein
MAKDNKTDSKDGVDKTKGDVKGKGKGKGKGSKDPYAISAEIPGPKIAGIPAGRSVAFSVKEDDTEKERRKREKEAADAVLLYKKKQEQEKAKIERALQIAMLARQCQL